MPRKCSTCAAMQTAKMAKPKDERRLRYLYYARIMERTERDIDLKGEWLFAGDYTFRPGPLNYCPECGKAVKWNADD